MIMIDPIIDKEIQNLIDSNIGDTQRLEYIRKSLQEEKKIYNSDQKYLSELLAKHSKDEDILERLDFLNPKKTEKEKTGATTTFADNVEENTNDNSKGFTQENVDQVLLNTKIKNEGTAFLLAIIFGILGFPGVGHIYIGKIKRGIGFILLMIPVGALAVAGMIFHPFFFISFLGIVVWLVVFIWQLKEVKKLCTQYNEHFLKTKEELW